MSTHVANLVIVNAGDVHLASISWFASEDTIRTPNKAVSSPVNKGIFGALDMSLANAMLECRGRQSIDVAVRGQPSVEFGVDTPDRFACVVAKSLLGVTEEDGRVSIAQFAAQRL